MNRTFWAVTCAAVATSLLAVVTGTPPAQAATLAAAVTPAALGGTPANRGDLLVDGWGDASGYHLGVARAADGYRWQEVALLHPAGLDPASWTGYQCTSPDGRYEAVVVAPADAANSPALRDHGGMAYTVDLGTGRTRPLVSGVGLWYHSPGCGPDDRAAFTSSPGTGERTTVITVADLATAEIITSGSVAGQVTSAVPDGSGVDAVHGTALIALPIRSRTVLGPASTLAALPGRGYDLLPASDGGLDLATVSADSRTSTVWHVVHGRTTRYGSGAAAAVRLFAGRGGRNQVAGLPAPAGTGSLRPLAPAATAPGTDAVSLDGSVTAVPSRTGRAGPPQVVETRSGRTVDPGTAAVPHAPATSSVAVASAALGAVPVAATTLRPASTTASPCAVPRLDPDRQVMQPNTARVDWATQLDERGLLTATRPANYANLGLAAYAPSSDFPPTALSHPSGDTWNTVPRSVMEAVLAQESNWAQASWHALPGTAADPLIGDYYGSGGTIDSINYAAADCGYGVAQVTTGMSAGDTVFSAHGQMKIAVDYAENIAAGLNILQDIWNQLYADGITANNGDPKYLENWYFAVWAYNSGIQPTAAFGNPGCTPGPSCAGPDGTWGLGWSNNPANPAYPPNRLPYLQSSYADAAHPGNWPYQERIMGWMASPLVDSNGTPRYATPTYHGGSTWLQLPGFSTFCSMSVNDCAPGTGGAAPTCTLADSECWWHAPATWVSSCASTCATSAYTVNAGTAEPALTDPYPPTCSLDTAVVPTTAAGPPVVVDEQPSPALNLQGCAASNWSSNGTFQYTYGTDASGNPVGAIDTHQLGSGLGGRILFTHTESGAEPSLINTGTWKPNLPKLQYYTVKVHLPATGASATNVVYTINPGGSAAPWHIRVNQHWDSEQWVTIGTFAMQNGGTVQLTNQSPSVAPGTDYYDYDVAFDAVAFVPQGGTPGQPIGGPATVLDAPKGSNPALVQCGCVHRTAGDPVDTATGYFGDQYTDLSTPGRGLPLTVTRTYTEALADPAGPNGAQAVNGPFGWGWASSYTMTATTNATTGTVTVRQEDNSQVAFTLNGTAYNTATPRFDATLVRSGSNYVFTRRGRDLFTFDAATGRLTAESDLAGAKAVPPYATTLGYNAAGQLSTVTDPAGRSYNFGWTGSHITSLSDGTGRQVSYGYDTAGDLTDVYGVGTTRTPTPGDDDHTRYGYTTATHLMTSIRTPDDFGSAASPTPVTSMAYDSAERVTAQTDPTGHTTAFAYGPAGALAAGQTQITDPAGHRTVDTYQNGLLVSETKGAGTADAGTWTYAYDPITLGVSVSTDPDGGIQTYSYDSHGNRTSASDGDGNTTAYTYDNTGDQLTAIDPRGVQTTYTYDGSGHIPSTATGERVVTGMTIAQLDQSAEIATGGAPGLAARSTSSFYDDPAHPGDLTRSVDGDGHTTTTGYDAYGDLTSRADPLGDTTQYGYDTARGLLATAVAPDGVTAGVHPGCAPLALGCTGYAHDVYGHVTGITDPLGHVTATGFDADGNQTSSTDALNRATTTAYDAADRPTTTTRPDGTTTTTAYNTDGTVGHSTDGAGHATTYGYDGQGRRGSSTDPDGHTTSARLDPAGRPAVLTDAAGATTTYSYDPAGLLTHIAYSGSTPAVSYGYDSAGERVTMSDGTGTSTWSYDAFGEVVAQTEGSGAASTYTFDNSGQLTAIGYPAAGQSVARGYDNSGRLTSVTDWSGRTTTFDYDPSSTLLHTTYPNGDIVTDTHDNAGSLAATTLTASGATLASLTYGRDSAGELTSSTPTGLGGSAQSYGYDPLGQLTSSTSSAYAYTPAGYPTTEAGTGQVFDVAGQLCWSKPGSTGTSPTCGAPAAGATVYGYSATGRRTSASTAGTTTTYGFDQGGHLTSITGPTSAAYQYDGAGRRVAKTVGSTATSYTWDNQAIPNLLSDGTTSYLYGPGNLPIEQVGAAAPAWFLHDQSGSTRALLDLTGSIAASYSYSDYGVSTRTGSADTALRYAGQYTDAESGLSYLRARSYDPSTAQFLTPDPAVGLTGAPYEYGANSPLNHTDPTGLFCFSASCLLHDTLKAASGVTAGAQIVTDGLVVLSFASAFVLGPEMLLLTIDLGETSELIGAANMAATCADDLLGDECQNKVGIAQSTAGLGEGIPEAMVGLRAATTVVKRLGDQWAERVTGQAGNAANCGQ